jgi:hypothetical protein
VPIRIRDYYHARITRAEPPPFWKRGLVLVLAVFTATLAVLLLSGNPLGESLLIALVAGLVLGLLMARILPIRLRERERR